MFVVLILFGLQNLTVARISPPGQEEWIQVRHEAEDEVVGNMIEVF